MTAPKPPLAHFEVTNEAIRAQLNELAKKLNSEMPKGWGFTLLMYEFDPGDSLFYISNAQRADMMKTMRECIKKFEAN